MLSNVRAILRPRMKTLHVGQCSGSRQGLEAGDTRSGSLQIQWWPQVYVRETYKTEVIERLFLSSPTAITSFKLNHHIFQIKHSFIASRF